MSKTRKLLGLFLLCLFWGGIFGLSDQLFGVILEPALYQEGGVPEVLFTLLWAEMCYLPLGVLGFFFFSTPAKLIRLNLSEKFLSLASGIWAGCWVLFFIPVFPLSFLTRSGLVASVPGRSGGTFLDWSGILGLSLVVGAGFYQVGERWSKSFWEKALASFFLWLGLIMSLLFLLLGFLELGWTTSFRKYWYLAGVGFGILVVALCWLGISRKKLGAKLSLAGIFLGILFWLWQSYPRVLPAPEQVFSPRRKFNIIFLLADALRSDALGIYAGRNSTPTLDRLAKQGIWFRRVISQASWTLPSVAGIFTSQYPVIFEVEQNKYLIPESFELLAERLQKAGYYTVAFVSNCLLGKKNGFLQGFEQVKLFHHHIPLHRQFGFLPRAYQCLRYFYRAFHLCFFPDTSKILTDWTIKFLRSSPREPFFLYVHYMDPHDPYSPSPQEEEKIRKKLGYSGSLHSPFVVFSPYLFTPHRQQRKEMQKVAKDDLLGQRFVRELYLAEVRRLDFQLARLINTLKELGLREKTILILTSDHGEEFWEHGRNRHGHTAFQELLSVPLILWGGDLKPTVVDKPVELIDLTPSLMEYLGIPPNPLDRGKSFWSLLGSSEPGPRYYFSLGGWGTLYAVQDTRNKLIFSKSASVKPQLFDLKKDPGEKKNIYSPHHPEFIRLKAVLDKWLEENNQLKAELGTQPLSKKERESLELKLRSLGYIR